MITENVSTLKINKLTQEQYNRALEAGNIKDNEIYLTPIEEVGVENITKAFTSQWDESEGDGISLNRNASSVIKYGKIIQGSIRFGGTPSEWNTKSYVGFQIPSEYFPRDSHIASVFNVDNVFHPVMASGVSCIIDELDGFSVRPTSEADFQYLKIQFLYITN